MLSSISIPSDLVVETCFIGTLSIESSRDSDNTPYSKMAADLCGYKLALVASFKIKYSFEF